MAFLTDLATRIKSWANGKFALASEVDNKANTNGSNVIASTFKTNLSLSNTDVGLGNVLNLEQIPVSQKGSNNGVAELDGTGKVPSSQLPAFVDDVQEYANQGSFPATGSSGIIYVAQDTNKTYRWSGSSYVEISESLALGTTSSTAYRGDHGLTAYNHSQVTDANPHDTNIDDILVTATQWSNFESTLAS